MKGSDTCEIHVRATGGAYTATVERRARWWIGWVGEVGGVNSQARTREELVENLGSALEEALEMQ